MKIACLLAFFTAALVLAGRPASTAERTVKVFAAASLTDALNEIGKHYEARTGKHVTLVFAASSTLARQIEASAGADIFFSADLAWMDYLDRKGFIAHDSRRNLLGNRLVLVAPTDSTVSLRIVPHFGLAAALSGGRLAIADPAAVPAGKYAREALIFLGIWDSVAGHLAQAENVRAALAYVARDECPLGIVYETDARAEPKVRLVGTFPSNTHAPIVYPVALTREAGTDARQFLMYLYSAESRQTFRKRGFTVLRK